MCKQNKRSVMTTNTDKVSTALETSPQQTTMIGLINQCKNELGKCLPKHLSPERMVRIATTCVRTNPKLAQCTPASFMGALFTASQLGLEPVSGLAYLIPFVNSKMVNGTWQKVTEVQLVLGYKGIAELFYRHEKSGLIDWGVVHEKDEFNYELGTNAHLKHKPAAGERGKVIGYYCIYTLLNGLKKFNYMTHAECMAHGKKHSKTFDNNANAFNKKSPWFTSEDSMCLKTVMLQGSKTVPMSTELRRALDADETSREFKDGVTDALDLPVTTNWQEAEAEQLVKADTSKVSAAISQDPAGLTPEQIKALEERANRGKDTTEAAKDAPEATEAPPNEPKGLSVKGIVTDYYPAKGKGPASFKVGGYKGYLKTFNKDFIDILIDHKADGDEVEVGYEVVTKGEYTNSMITGISVQAENRMGDTQPGD